MQVGAGARLRFYGGLFLVTAATLMLQIIETRIISVTSWYHLAFFVISIAMFGLTAGAVWIYLRRDAITAQNLERELATYALGFALTTAIALLAQMTLVTSYSTSLTALVAWAELAICLAIPFFFSGCVVSLALTRSPYPIGWVYGVDLVGAAVGCLGVLLVMEVASAPAAVLWIAVLIAAAALLFAGEAVPAARGLGGAVLRYRWTVAAGLLVVALGNSLLGVYGVRPAFVKDRLENTRTHVFEQWNSFSRITLTDGGVGSPAMWGASPVMPQTRIRQQWMTIDGAAGTSMYQFDGHLADLWFLRYDITNLAYALPGLAHGAVIGVGGGRDVLSAKVFGLEDVVGVEINPILIDLLTNRRADFTAIARTPGVSLEIDEARSWFARATREFDIIQMSLIDTWAATGAGAYTLTENGLYTIEAWRIFLSRLSPSGVYTVSRWYAPDEPAETGRMLSLAAATLMDQGVADPSQHLYLASAGNIATVIVSREPFTPAALDALDAAVAQYRFEVLFSPRVAATEPVLQAIATATDPASLEQAAESHLLDLTPSTDSRPFFFNQLRFDRLLDPRSFNQEWRPGVHAGNLMATLTLAMLVLVSAVLVVTTIVLPLRSSVRDAGWTAAVAGTAYFLLIGVGFMMTEIALLQRMSVFLGHPVYALSVVLFSLILSTGIGSLASERLKLDTYQRLLLWAVASALYLFALPFWLPPLLLSLDSADLLVRAGFAVLVLAPAGFLMGFGFPTGMRMIQVIDSRPMPWFWGINGAGGVMAASVAVFVSLGFSIDASLQTGAICYLLLALPALFLARASGEPRPALAPAE